MGRSAVLSGSVRKQRQAAIETADIVDLSHEARGVAHCDGKATFIDDALPGERVAWSLRKRGRTFDEGKLERVLQPSPDRVEPRCAHFGVCGGCALQHLSSARQIEFKQRQLLEALTRIGHVTAAQVLPSLQADVWNYRRRARFAARWVPKKGRVLVGFRERATPYIADIQRCEVVSEPVAGMILPLCELLGQLSIRDRVPQIEVAVADHDVALVLRVLAPPTAADIDLIRAFAAQQQVQMYLQPGGYDTIAPLDGPLDGMAGTLTYALPQFDVELEFQPTDFVQINGAMNRQMLDRALQLLQVEPQDHVLDLFCGLGNFSLPLARRAQQVVGVEGEAGLVARARANARRNGIANAEFFTANLMDEKPIRDPWAGRPYDKVLIDPLLVNEHGFILSAAGVMDMFPHTTHVESIAVFERG